MKIKKPKKQKPGINNKSHARLLEAFHIFTPSAAQKRRKI